MSDITTFAIITGLTGCGLGLAFYLDSHENDPPPGGIFQWHTHLYDRVNRPPIGKLLPIEKFGYRGFYYVDSSYTQPQTIDVNSVGNIPILPVEPKIIYRRPFRGLVDCLIWVMGTGRKYGELQVVGDRFALARSKFICETQNPVLFFYKRRDCSPTGQDRGSVAGGLPMGICPLGPVVSETPKKAA
jgi:hypothetical protein